MQGNGGHTLPPPTEGKVVVHWIYTWFILGQIPFGNFRPRWIHSWSIPTMYIPTRLNLSLGQFLPFHISNSIFPVLSWFLALFSLKLYIRVGGKWTFLEMLFRVVRPKMVYAKFGVSTSKLQLCVSSVTFTNVRIALRELAKRNIFKVGVFAVGVLK